MASYVGNYTNDVGIQYKNVVLNTYFYDNGSKVSTTYETDEIYLPTVFRYSTTPLINKKSTCKIDYSILRVAQCYISENVYYEIPCPFQGGTTEFIAFLTELNNNSMFAFVNLRGESLPYGYSIYL
jgi:hypothetical protein